MRPQVSFVLFNWILRAAVVGKASGFCGPPILGQAGSRSVARWRSTKDIQSSLGPLHWSFFNGPERSNRIDDDEMLLLEEEVISSVQAQVDQKNAKRAVVNALSDPSPAQVSRTTPQWAAAIAAGIAAGSISFFTLHNAALGVIVALGVGVVASRNPMEEQDAAGAIARTVSGDMCL